MNEWISIDEGKPPTRQTVLFYDSEYDIIAIGRMPIEDDCCRFYENDSGRRYLAVTHWMPMPSRPEVEDI